MVERKLISRKAIAQRLGVQTQTIAAWERQGKWPEPAEWISERVILYDVDAVEDAIRNRAAMRRARTPPQRRTA
jgi:uncharacterized protein YjcR